VPGTYCPIEIHTVELSKYNGTKRSVLAPATWNNGAIGLRMLTSTLKKSCESCSLDSLFLKATSELREIQEITEEKEMYDSREKAILDYASNLVDAREEGQAIGLDKGQAIGRIQLLQDFLSR
jgi:hypothetical protein